MRTFTISSWLVAVCLLLACSNAVKADDPAAKSADDCLKLIGGKIGPLFAKFGGPNKAQTVRQAVANQDMVLMWYDQFEVRVNGYRTVDALYLNFADWKTPIRGIKAGATQEEVRKILGEPASIDLKGNTG